MFSFLNKYFNLWKAQIALKNCLVEYYSAAEHRAIARVQSNIKAFLLQCGDKTLLMNVYDNPGKFNPLYIGQKPIGKQNYTIADLIPFTSAKEALASFLFLLASRLKPKSVLELGTHLGISGMYLASGVSLNSCGVFYTIDRSNDSLKYAKVVLKPWQDRVKMINGEFSQLSQDIFSECGKIGLAFIDGDHYEGAMTQYFNIVFPAMAAGGVIVFDDIKWSPYTIKDWEIISEDRRVFFNKDCGRFGFIIIK